MHSLALRLRRWGLLQYESWTGNPNSLDVNEWGQKENFQLPVESSFRQHRYHESVGTGQAKQLTFRQFCFSSRWAAPVYLPAHTGTIIYVKSNRSAFAQCLFFDCNFWLHCSCLFCWIWLEFSVLCSHPQWKENHLYPQVLETCHPFLLMQG